MKPHTSSSGATSIPPVNSTLRWVTIQARLLGWVWHLVVASTTVAAYSKVDWRVVAGAAGLATAWTAVTMWAARADGFLGNPAFVILDGLVSVALMSAAIPAGAQDFISGGYPASWLFVVAYGRSLRWTITAAVSLTAVFALFHTAMGLPIERTAGSVQFVVFGVLVGWAFDTLRKREKLRLEAERGREYAEKTLAIEREAAVRLEERQNIARRLHDSVLQTLKLVQIHADDPHEVRYLARRQERGLRHTIDEYRSPHGHSFRADLLAARDEVEDLYRVEIEAVIRDDTEVTSSLAAGIEAAREAMTNAAKHSGSERIDLYSEIGPQGCQINVRDRGRGFDPSSKLTAAGGLADSMASRVASAGGAVSINAKAGEGTDVTITIPGR